MKRFKIRNPVARWFAGLGFILACIAVGGSALVGICYGMGRLTLPFWMNNPRIIPGPYGFVEIFLGGFFTMVAIMLAILIGFLISMGIYFGVRWTGNSLFNQIAKKSRS